MARDWIFDREHALRINARRSEVLTKLLQDIRSQVSLETALDAGCGIGSFSEWLSQAGLRVTGIDVREENLQEARKRCPGIPFARWNIEDPAVQTLGSFEMVLCFGLLYHLENPFQAIRNLFELTSQVLIIESIIAPGRLPIAVIADEMPGEDQSIHSISLIPSETAFIRMLYSSGFPRVYRILELPDHEQFRESASRHRRRTMLVAARVEINSRLLSPVTEPAPIDWHAKKSFVFELVKRIRRKA